MKKKHVVTHGVTGILIFIILFSGSWPSLSGAATDVRDSVVKVYTVKNLPDYDSPWNPLISCEVYGSGCVIRGNRILTNAHMVSDQTFIQVRRHGKSRKHTARVLAVSHAADLALLTVEDPAFFHGIVPLELGELPQVQQDVMVYGFPKGGDVLSSTKGVISRIEHQDYVHSTIELLAAQIDAAVNPGNSGGPVMVGDRVVGIVMQLLTKSQNISYMVPVPVIRHFLEDMEDGRLDGFPEDGIVFQEMENEALRKKYGIGGDQSGVLVINVFPGTPAEGKVLPGDVILSVDGFRVADDGTVEFRPGERTASNYCTQMHQLGEELVLEIMRKGEKHEVRLTLDRAWGRHTLVPMPSYDVMPTYYIYGGLVFCPLTYNYLSTWGNDPEEDAPTGLSRFLVENKPGVQGEEVVIMLNVLSSDVNNSYRSLRKTRITKVNGRRIINLKDLIQKVEDGRGQRFVAFESDREDKIVLDREKAEKAHPGILRTYRVPSDRSEDLPAAGESPAPGEAVSLKRSPLSLTGHTGGTEKE